ncbi:hypothetical protein B0H14DRAFT_3770128 [Mycena olivaceomarginata]|nr:hypothetical protein B0H14DRAFT_3770128 [Mycena olivaceomarginata]
MAGVPKSLSFSDWGAIVTLSLTCIVSVYYIRPKKPHARLPPGPQGLPFIGNVLDIPTKSYWLEFAELRDVWGDILSLTAFWKTIIIINSLEVTKDLLDVRGANFSDRPVIPMGGELAGFNNTPPVSSLRPDGLIDEFDVRPGAISLRIAYGYRLRDGPERDPFLEMFETVEHNFFNLATRAAFLMDIIPVCESEFMLEKFRVRYWPEWLPGGGFHTLAKMWSNRFTILWRCSCTFISMYPAVAGGYIDIYPIAGAKNNGLKEGLLGQKED